MLSIILAVLKVIGLILLIIISVLIALALITLFVPLRYSVGIVTDSEQCIQAKASFFLHFLRIRCDYVTGKNKQVIFEIRLFGVKINLDRKKKIKEKPAGEYIEKHSEESSVKKISKEELIEENSAENTSIDELVENESTDNSESEKKSFSFKAEEIKTKFLSVYEKVKKIYDELSDEKNQKAFSHIIKSLKKILKHYLPRSIVGEGSFSLGDPANTGKLLGLLYAIPFVLREDFRIIDVDFDSDKAYFKGNIFIKGHIRLNHLIAEAIGLLLDENIRRIIKMAKKRR